MTSLPNPCPSTSIKSQAEIQYLTRCTTAKEAVRALARCQIVGFTHFTIHYSNKREEQKIAAAHLEAASKVVEDLISEKPEPSSHTMFSATDDEWEEHMGERSGVSLDDSEEHSEQLEKVQDNEHDSAGATLYHTDSKTGRRFMSSQNHRELASLAREYLDSHPNSDTVHQIGRFHHSLRNWLAEETTPHESWYWRAEATIRYRFYVMKAADVWRHTLGLQFDLSCMEADLSAIRKGFDGPQRMLFDEIRNELNRWALFDEPLGEPEGGVVMPKGFNYLAATFVHNNVKFDKAIDMLRPFFKNRDPRRERSGFPIVAGVSRYSRVMARVERHPEIQECLRKIANALGRSFRELDSL